MKEQLLKQKDRTQLKIICDAFGIAYKRTISKPVLITKIMEYPYREIIKKIAEVG